MIWVPGSIGKNRAGQWDAWHPSHLEVGDGEGGSQGELLMIKDAEREGC